MEAIEKAVEHIVENNFKFRVVDELPPEFASWQEHTKRVLDLAKPALDSTNAKNFESSITGVGTMKTSFIGASADFALSATWILRRASST